MTLPAEQSKAPQADEFEAEQFIRGMYRGLLGREADAQGLAHWIAVWSAGTDLPSITANFLTSEEYSQRVSSQRKAIQDSHRQMEEIVKNVPVLLASRPITIVDVGAQNLTDEDHIYGPLCKRDIPYRIVGFEPLEHRREERLRQAADHHLVLLPAFIGDGSVHTFHVNAPDATSSLLPFNRAVTGKLDGLDGLHTVKTELAHTTTLDSALKGTEDVDFIKLDIQGAELTALRHASSVLKRALVVHCEVSFVEIYGGQALFSEVEQYMRSSGFDLVDFHSLCRYPLTKTPLAKSRDYLGWGDAVFFRRLPDSSPWREFLVQSIIALTVYDKPSLATWLASTLDKTPAASYWGALHRSNT